MPELSVVLPAYNEEKEMVEKAADTLKELFERENIDYEIVFVNDGSKDRTWEKLMNICKLNNRVSAVNFSRNFGKEAAVFADLRTSMENAVLLWTAICSIRLKW